MIRVWRFLYAITAWISDFFEKLSLLFDGLRVECWKKLVGYLPKQEVITRTAKVVSVSEAPFLFIDDEHD